VPELKKMITTCEWSDKGDVEPLENQEPYATKCVTAKEWVVRGLHRPTTAHTRYHQYLVLRIDSKFEG